MLGRSHVVTALCVGVIGVSQKINAYTMPSDTLPFFFAGVAVGALLPDLDHPQSMISRRLPIVGGLVGRLFVHRGLLHSLMGVLLIFGGIWLTLPVVSRSLSISHNILVAGWGGLLVGYVVHILGDILTVSGVRLFYPARQSVRLPLMVTGSLIEYMFVLACVALMGVFLWI